MLKIGIDLGGTKIEGVILDNRGEVIERRRIPTEQQKGYNQILENVVVLYQLLRSKINNRRHTVGIGTPGYLDEYGKIRNSSLLCLNEKYFALDFERLSGVLPLIENDANCFAISEALMGAGKDHKLVFGVIMGTGCGGGVVFNKSIIHGAQYLGGEIGHTIIHPEGIKCFCGKKGCVERYISGPAVEDRYELLSGNRKELKQIVHSYRKGELDAVQVMDEFFGHFAIAMSNIINLLDPDKIVLGGGLSNIDEIYTIGVERVRNYVFKENPAVNIVKNKLGDSAGVIGAALLNDLI